MTKQALFISTAIVATLTLAGCAEGSGGNQSPSAAPAPAASSATSNPYVSATPPAGPSALGTADSTLGKIVVDGKGMTAYVFDNDTVGSGVSACTGDCLKMWIPITADSGTPDGAGVTAPVGTIRTPDGTFQVTVAGLPLYTFVKDTAPGNTNGQLIKGIWHVISPNGDKIS